MQQCSCCSVQVVPWLVDHCILHHQRMRELKESDDLNKILVYTLGILLYWYLPPSSFAMTSALSSTVVYAIELLEFPKEIPMACLSAGLAPLVGAGSPILFDLKWRLRGRDYGDFDSGVLVNIQESFLAGREISLAPLPAPHVRLRCTKINNFNSD